MDLSQCQAVNQCPLPAYMRAVHEDDHQTEDALGSHKLEHELDQDYQHSKSVHVVVQIHTCESGWGS